MAKTLIIGSDHGGFVLKEALKPVLEDMGFELVDVGCDSQESCDYPTFAKALAAKVEDTGAPGILICGTGLGMSMAANRHQGIRAAVCTNEYMARMARAHNDANVLCLGERVIGPGVAADIVRTFLDTAFEGDRHARRVQAIETD